MVSGDEKRSDASGVSSSVVSSSVVSSSVVSVVIVLRATRGELPGAALVVAGLSVLERSVRQLVRDRLTRKPLGPAAENRVIDEVGARRTIGRIVLAADGSVALPRRLPPDVEVRHLDVASGDAASVDAALAALLEEWPRAVIVGGDVLRRTSEVVGEGRRITGDSERRAAEELVFADLLRGDLGFIARHVNKAISFRITRYLLCRLPFTPNQVTVASALFGLWGCVLLSRGSYAAAVAGMVVAQGQSILDGCDGELARVRFQQSEIGEWLDSLMDDGLNLALVIGLAAGLAKAGWGAGAWALGGTTAAMLFFYNAISYRELFRQGLGGEILKIRWKINRGKDMKALWATPGAIGPAKRFLLTLGRRDTFVFGWMVLAVLNLLPIALFWAFAISIPWFVAAVAQLVMPEEVPAP